MCSYEEKLREDALRGEGLAVVRWGWSDLSTRSHVVERAAAASALGLTDRAQPCAAVHTADGVCTVCTRCVSFGQAARSATFSATFAKGGLVIAVPSGKRTVGTVWLPPFTPST